MGIFKFAVKSTDEILNELSTNQETGLSSIKATQRLKKYGYNVLDFRRFSPWRIFFRQFSSAFIYLLIGAMAITLILREYTDALMIFIFIAVNTVLGFYQEYKSEKTIDFLSKYTLPRSKVLRQGKIMQITSDALVPGDIVILETGDKVPADVRIIEQNSLVIDETVLTGESVPVYKKEEKMNNVPGGYHKALNLGFSGTDVVKGKAKAIVLATGKNTAFGNIAKLTVESRKISDFEKGISRFSGFIMKLIGVTLIIVFLANIFIKKGGVDIWELIIFSMALTVSVIPEALPLVTTFSLSRGAARLAKDNVVVKRLSAIEDLGGIEILCSDKTGTLTENKLTIANFYSEDNDFSLFLGNLASAFEQKKRTEPFDIALCGELSAAQKNKINKSKKIVDIPFSPELKRNIVLVETNNKRRLLITRGAPENIMDICRKKEIKNRQNIEEWIDREGEQGHRVLAIAYKDIPESRDENKNHDKIIKEKNFIFGGIISFIDPIKPTTYEAVKKAELLGVRMVVITGDSISVSGAVGAQIGLIDSPDKVISGSQWEKMNSKEKNKCLKTNSVFARVSPEQKFKIIQSFRNHYTVGFFGEGINDAPALKIAGVSIVVDSAADIAREAADIILLKKNLKVILNGVEEGRKVFSNTTKYIKSTLASNFGNFFAVATASLLIDYLPMLPLQILLLNLLSDTPMISISTDNVDKEQIISPKKYEVKEIIIVAIILGLISTIFDFIFFGTFFRFSPEVLRTNWFIGSILTELVLIFSIRTNGLFLKGSSPSRSIIWLSIIVFVATIGLPYSSFGQNVFDFTPPTAPHLFLILSLVAVYFVCSEIVKLIYYKSRNNNELIVSNLKNH